MSAYPNALEMQRQNEMRRIADAQNRLAMLDQQAQMQAQQNQYNQNMNFGQPQVQFLGINGKFIQAPENITANDVPMDGSVAVFPMQDMSQILVKAWQSDGTIRTVTFKPVLEERPNNLPQAQEKLKFDLSDDATEAFMKRFDDITERLEKMEKSFAKPTSTRNKKEVDADE